MSSENDHIDDDGGLEKLRTVPSTTVIEDMLSTVANVDIPLPVVDEAGILIGGISRQAAIEALTRPDGAVT